MTFEYWWKTTGIASMGMQPGDVYRAARDTALAAWEAATKAEREACAQVCESWGEWRDHAAAIRARSDK